MPNSTPNLDSFLSLISTPDLTTPQATLASQMLRDLTSTSDNQIGLLADLYQALKSQLAQATPDTQTGPLGAMLVSMNSQATSILKSYEELLPTLAEVDYESERPS